MISSLLLADRQGLKGDDNRMYAQAEMVKQLLTYCSLQPGAKVTIAVTHEHGHTATAELYDAAALIQPLCDALTEFQRAII